MPKDFSRSRRIAEQVQRELSEIIRMELKDPRVGMITITEVEVTPDTAYARVYFTLMGDAERIKETTAALTHAAGFLRSELAHRMKLRIVPQLVFKYDVSVERGARLSQLIDAAVADDAKRRRRRK
ncbi:MAG: ribosome-binding factor A [Betaproteobacteria bacterium SG8_41]|jgi:ribosome-binding factor A|nr:MAG: ribosome-binding factor A [Betaproteobacteria bacterium SG8_41]